VNRSSEVYRTAAVTAKQLGITVRALRIYERHGVVRPRRTAAGWRVYGPEEIARLHQVLELKRLGLTLAQIARLIRGDSVDLAGVLELQEQELSRRQRQVDRALVLVRQARSKLARGTLLPIDELITLIMETHMNISELQVLAKRAWNSILAVHPEWTAQDLARLKACRFELAAETERLKSGDPASPEAADLVRRWRALVDEMTRGDPELVASATTVYREGFSNPEVARHMPFSMEAKRFLEQARAHLSEAKG
jgi:MerR family transcriptional regulator, thiopeptide resistance regulator